MKKPLLLAALLVPVLALSACGPDRAATDMKLKAACAAAARAAGDYNDTLDIRKEEVRSEEGHEGVTLRVVELRALYAENHGIIEEKVFTCAFEETVGMLSGYQNRFYNMDMAGARYGNFDGKLEGDFSEMMKINAAVAEVLY